MTKEAIQIRNYEPNDYQAVRQLYKDSGWFDPETDAEERLKAKSERDPQSLLVATDPDNILGTVSLIEDGRIALFFRLVTKDGDDAPAVRKRLLAEGEVIFKQKGYNESHIIAPESDTDRQNEYQQNGFQKGNPYRWMWKKLQ
jgi:hypothetical protein